MSPVLRSTVLAVVEAPQGVTPAELSQRALELRLRQQEILADLGVLSLHGIAFQELLDHAVRLVAEGLQAEFAKVMQYLPDKGLFLVIAGVGWNGHVVGEATIGADLASPGGFALRTGKPVISNHLDREDRFRTPALLARYGIRRAINVILKGDGAPFGVLEVDSRSTGEFSLNDVAFLQSAANVIGTAIERQRMDRDLRAALDSHKMLMAELNHRIKNSLQLVASMLQLQADAKAGGESERDLKDAATRVMAIAHVHESLYNGGTLQAVDVSRYLAQVCGDLNRSGGPYRVAFTAAEKVLVPVDRAVPIALVVNELVTNAMKYAYPEAAGGCITVRLEVEDNTMRIGVRDEGIGLPAGFDPAGSRGLGMRIIQALARQLDATLEMRRPSAGAEFVLVVPMAVSATA